MWLGFVPRPDVPEYSVHQVLWGYFPGIADGEPRPFLWREERGRLLLLSRIPPACPAVHLLPRIEAGRALQFRVLVSPANGKKDGAGRRKRVAIEGNEQRKAWLARRFAPGAEITFAHVYDRPELRFRRAGGAEIVVTRCEARGTILVRDREAFVTTMLQGVGGRGCWGCGLLVLPELMPEIDHGLPDRAGAAGAWLRGVGSLEPLTGRAARLSRRARAAGLRAGGA